MAKDTKRWGGKTFSTFVVDMKTGKRYDLGLLQYPPPGILTYGMVDEVDR